IERALPVLRRQKLEAMLFEWLTSIPDDIVRSRPVINTAFASALLARGDWPAAEDRLSDVERRLSGDPAKIVVADEEEFRNLRGVIAVYRSGHALVLGDLSTTGTYARQVLELAAEDNHLLRG